MDDKMIEQPKDLKVPEMTVYEQLYSRSYAYRFDAIGFLELLECIKETLHI